MSSSPAEFAAKCERMAMTIPRAQREAVFSASLAAKDVFLAAAAGAGLRPGQKMRGVGKSGARWGVGFNIKGEQNPTSLIRFRGPVHLVDRPTAAHTIAPRRRGVKALRTGGGGDHDVFAASAKHPGTKGKNFYDPAERQVIAQTPPIMAAAMRRALIQNFGR